MSSSVEMGREYQLIGQWTKIAHYGFVERVVEIVKFFQADYYGKGATTYVTTAKRVDLRRPDSDEVCFGNVFGGSQTAHPATVARYVERVQQLAS